MFEKYIYHNDVYVRIVFRKTVGCSFVYSFLCFITYAGYPSDIPNTHNHKILYTIYNSFRICLPTSTSKFNTQTVNIEYPSIGATLICLIGVHITTWLLSLNHIDSIKWMIFGIPNRVNSDSKWCGIFQINRKYATPGSDRIISIPREKWRLSAHGMVCGVI